MSTHNIFFLQKQKYMYKKKSALLELCAYIFAVRSGGYKTFFMLNSTEHEISLGHKNTNN